MMARIFMIFIALGCSLEATMMDNDVGISIEVSKKDKLEKLVHKDNVDMNVIERAIIRRSKTSQVTPLNASASLTTTKNTDIDYKDLVKHFDEEVKIDGCNNEMKLKRHAVVDLNEILSSNITSKLNSLTNGQIDGETQFTPDSVFAVNHCNKLFTFDNLKSRGNFFNDNKHRFHADDVEQPLKLVFNYIDMHNHISGVTSSTSELPNISVEREGSYQLPSNREINYRSLKSSSKRSAGAGVGEDLTMLHSYFIVLATFNFLNIEDHMTTNFGLNRNILVPTHDPAGILGELVVNLMLGNYQFASYYTKTNPTPIMAWYKRDVREIQIDAGNEYLNYFNTYMTIFCKNDLVYSRCAILGYFDDFAKAPMYVGNLRISEIRNEFSGCFVKPAEVIFQSAKYEIDGELKFEEDQAFKSVLINTRPAQAEEMEDPGIFAGTAFRYLNKDWPDRRHDVRVFIHPRRDSYIFTFPDLKPLTLKQIIHLMYDDCHDNKILDTNPHLKAWLYKNDQTISVDYIKIIRDGILKTYISVKKRVTKEIEKEYFQLIPEMAFTRIHKSSILLAIDPSLQEHQLALWRNKVNENPKGDGMVDENMDEMLGSPFHFYVDGEYMKFDIKVPSNRYVMLGLKQTSPSTGYYEADAYGYITSFESLNNFPLTSDLWLDVPLQYGGDTRSFVANATMNRELNGEEVPIEGLRFRMEIKPDLDVAKDGSSITFDTFSCLHTTEPGKMSDFINAIHEKPFFSQDWINYGGIGIAFTPNSQSTADDLCTNDYNDGVDLHQTYYVQEGIHAIRSGPDPLKIISSLSPTFEIEMYVKINVFVNGWTSIFQMSVGDDYCKGCRIPGVFVTRNEPKLFYICQTMNKKEQECLFTPPITKGAETHLKITQTQTSISEYSFQVHFNGKRLSGELISVNPQTFENVKVFAGNTWRNKYRPQPGSIRDLKITGGGEGPFEQLKELESNSGRSHQISPNLGADYMVRLELKFNGGESNIFTIKNSANQNIIWIDIISITAESGASNVRVCYSKVSPQCKEAKVSHGEWTNIRLSQHEVGNNYMFSALVGDTQVHDSTISDASSLGGKTVNIGIENRNLMITAFPTEVGVTVNKLTFVCDNDNTLPNNRQKTCLFLTKIIQGDLKEVDATLYGWMNKEELQLQGEITSINLAIRDGLQMKAEEDHKMLVEITQENLIFTGKIIITNFGTFDHSSYYYQGILKLSGDGVDLRITSSHPYFIHRPRDSEPAMAILFEGQRLYLQFNEQMDVTDVELNPQMCFGDPYKVYGLWVGKESLARMTLMDFNPAYSEFYACTEQQVHTKFSEFMTTLEKPGKKSFLDGSYIVDFCWARTDKAVWEVKELGKTFSRGLSYRGLISTTFGGEERYKLPLEGNKDQVCVEMPILGWANYEETPPAADGGVQIEEVPDSNILVKDRVAQEEQGMMDQPDSVTSNVGEADAVIIENHICKPKMRVVTNGESINHVRKPTFAECAKHCYFTYTRIHGSFWNGVKYDGGVCYCIHKMRYTEQVATYKSCALKAFDQFPVEMKKGTGIDETKGPRFCYHLNRATFEASLVGYLKTFAFEKQNAWFRGSVNEENGWIEEFVFSESNLPMFNGLKGSAELKLKRRDTDKPLNPTNMKMEMTLSLEELVNQNRLIDQLRGHIHNRFYIDDFQQRVRYFEEEKRTAQQKKSQLEGLINKRGLRRSFHVNSIDRARAMKSYKRDCPYECGYAKIPGWSIDHSCSKKSERESLSCLKYKKDAHVASNVGCIANCETERARSFIDAKELHKRTTADAERIEAVQECIGKIDNFISTSEQYKTRAQTLLDAANQLYSTLQSAEVTIERITLRVDDHLVLSKQTLRCHYVTIRYKMFLLSINQERTVPLRTQQRICFDGIYEELAYSLSKPLMDSIFAQEGRISNFEDLVKQHAIYKQFDESEDEEISSPYVKEFFQVKDDFTDCVEDVTQNENAKVKSSLMSSLTHASWNDFSEYEQNTVEAFHDTSPWEVAKRRNVIEEFSQLKTTLSQQNVTTSTDENSCMARKRTLDDYTNIVNYIHKWTEENKKAKREINSMDIANNFVKFASGTVSSGVKNYTDNDDDVALMSYWQSESKNGMKEWFQRESDMLDTYNKESLPLIRKQLNFMYTNDQHKTLRDYFNAQPSLENKNVQRQQIANSSIVTFTDVGKSLVDILDNGKTLEEIALPIEDILHHTNQLQKRSIPC